MERVFTLDEAVGTLPDAIPLVEALVEATARVVAPERRLELSRLTEANATSAAMAPLLEPAETVARLLIEIDALGIEVKDAATGLIDFPSERDGRPIHLCWQLGEPTIGYWHDRESGFAGRQPL